MRTTTIFMPLLGEGTDVWAPVSARNVGGGRYRVLGLMPAGEQWAFARGTNVLCEPRTFADGETGLAAVSMSDFSEVGGISLIVLVATWPLASMTASRDEIVVKCLAFRWRFQRKNSHLREWSGLFSSGIALSSSRSFVIFMSWDQEALKRKLTALGYQVAPGQ